MNTCLLDTNAFSILYDPKRAEHLPALARVVERCVGPNETVTISVVTYYESLRGLRLLELKQQGASKRARFNRLLRHTTVLPLNNVREGWLQATELWAQLALKGITLADADLLIATTALLHQRKLICHDQAVIRGLEALGCSTFVEPLDPV